MTGYNRDTITAAVLLVVCGAFWGASFRIPDMGYATIGSEVWPQLILVAFTGFCLLYLARSLRGPLEEDAEEGGARDAAKGWLARYRNVIVCFLAFGVFLVTLDYLGMLIGGVGFVFATLSLIGQRDLWHVTLHAVIALATVGAMWSLFTFGLGVILPQGEILRIL